MARRGEVKANTSRSRLHSPLPWSIIRYVAALLFTTHAQAQQQWFSVYNNGSKVGQALHEHRIDADRVIDLERTEIALKSGGRANQLELDLSYESTIDGRLLGYTSRLHTRDIDRVQHGTLHGETMTLTSSAGGIERHDDVTLAAATRWQMQEQGWLRAAAPTADRHLEFAAFDALAATTVPVEIRIGAREVINLNGEAHEAIAIVRRATYPDHVALTTSYVDDDYRPLRILGNIAGLELELLAATAAQAAAPNQPLDYLARLLVRSPYRIGTSALGGHLRYTLARRDGTALVLPATGEQRVRQTATGAIVDVCAHCDGEAATAPEPAALQANEWMQSDAPELRRVVTATARNLAPKQRMLALTDYVRLHMHGHSEFLGYISALEALRSGNGDCTAYALLLAALGRAAQIPTRMAVGMVYSPRFAEHNDTFGPHAWAQAWIDGRWQSFDAATEGFDNTHIALAVGQGDPARFALAMGALPQIEMRAAVQVASAMSGTNP